MNLFGKIYFDLKSWWTGLHFPNRVFEAIEVRMDDRKDWWKSGVVHGEFLSFRSGKINNKKILMNLLTSYRFWLRFQEYYDDKKDLSSFNFDRFTGDGYKIYKIISSTISERVL